MMSAIDRRIFIDRRNGSSSVFSGDGTKPSLLGKEYKQFVATKLWSYIATGNTGNIIGLAVLYRGQSPLFMESEPCKVAACQICI